MTGAFRSRIAHANELSAGSVAYWRQTRCIHHPRGACDTFTPVWCILGTSPHGLMSVRSDPCGLAMHVSSLSMVPIMASIHAVPSERHRHRRH